MNKKSNYKIIGFIVIILTFVILLIIKIDNKVVVKLDHCIDGDTASFIVNNEIKKVRFLAIDTPESVHPKKDVEPYGIEASEYTCNKLKNAKVIELEFDVNSDKYDKYKRLLAYVFVDDKLLQSILVNMGYAKVAYLYGNYKYTTILLNNEKEAKQKNIGIWYNN